jgi:hypothetical protein
MTESLGRFANRCGDRLHSEGRSGSFEGIQPIFGICRRCRIEQHRDPGDARRDLFEQLQPLASHRGLHSDETGDVPSRLRKARDKAAADRIGNERETMGMVRVSCSIIAVIGVLCVRMRSGCSATSSFANRCIDSTSPVVVQRVSIRILRPSAQPSFASPSRNAAMRACPTGSSAASGMSTPMRRIRSACCARPASGQTAAALPKSLMNLRRLMGVPKAKDHGPRYSRSCRPCIAAKSDHSCPNRVISLEGSRGRPSMHFRYSPKS